MLPPPYSLPVMVPGTVATIAAAKHGTHSTYTLTVRAGRPLTLAALAVGGVAAPRARLPTVLSQGHSFVW